VWSGNGFNGSADPGTATTGSEVGRLTFNPPADGFVLVTAHFEIRIRNTFDSTALDCATRTQIAASPATPGTPLGSDPTAPGYIAEHINANLPTEQGSGTYFGPDASISRVLPVTGGQDNTVYLNGAYRDNGSHCAQAIWGPITMTAVFFDKNPDSTFATP
jgi:hypothetical protein